MRAMKRLICATCLGLMAIPVIARAQEHSSMQDMERKAWPMRRSDAAGGGGTAAVGPTSRPWHQRSADELMGPNGPRWLQLPQPTEEEWAKASEFMKKELPNSWTLFDRMPERAWRRAEARRKSFS